MYTLLNAGSHPHTQRHSTRICIFFHFCQLLHPAKTPQIGHLVKNQNFDFAAPFALPFYPFAAFLCRV